jgi:hypothetical protein
MALPLCFHLKSSIRYVDRLLYLPCAFLTQTDEMNILLSHNGKYFID